MNRKLQHSMLALSTTAVVFTMLLVAGGPAPASRPMNTLSVGDEAILDTASVLADNAAETTQRRHLRHSRELLALPYFSFAQGLRRTRS